MKEYDRRGRVEMQNPLSAMVEWSGGVAERGPSLSSGRRPVLDSAQGPNYS